MKLLFQFQIEDAIKAARTEATEAYNQYVEEPKTSQRRGRFDLELEYGLEGSVIYGQETNRVREPDTHGSRTRLGLSENCVYFTLMLICFGLVSSFLGRVIVRTPLSQLASTFS